MLVCRSLDFACMWSILTRYSCEVVNRYPFTRLASSFCSWSLCTCKYWRWRPTLHCVRKPGKKHHLAGISVIFNHFHLCNDEFSDNSNFYVIVLYCRNYMNDSLRTNVFVRFSRETVACACIFLAARQLKVGVLQWLVWSILCYHEVCFL